MDIVSRLMRLMRFSLPVLLSILLMAFTVPASASFPATYQSFACTYAGGWNSNGSTAEAACRASATLAVSASDVIGVSCTPNPNPINGVCTVTFRAKSSGNVSSNLAYYSASNLGCGTGATNNSGTCTCNSGYQQVGSACQPPIQCPSGQTRDPDTNTCGCDSGYLAGGQMVTGDVETGCFGGCTIRLRTGWYDKTSNKTWGYDWLQNGNKCTASDVPVIASSDPAAQAASKCAVGQCPGTVNGQAVCVACTTQTTKQTDGTKTNSTEVSTSASGATSSQSTTSSSSSSTKCADGSCTTTTTTTTTNPDGSKKDTTSAKTEPKTDFCESNPKSTLCTSGTWGGTCGSFSCDGDAVTCAIAQASWKSACAIDIDASDTKVQSGNAARLSPSW